MDVGASVDSDALIVKIEAPKMLGVGSALGVQFVAGGTTIEERTEDGSSSSSRVLSTMIARMSSKRLVLWRRVVNGSWHCIYTCCRTSSGPVSDARRSDCSGYSLPGQWYSKHPQLQGDTTVFVILLRGDCTEGTGNHWLGLLYPRYKREVTA